LLLDPVPGADFKPPARRRRERRLGIPARILANAQRRGARGRITTELSTKT
jgi:hypothetical protein